MSRKLNISGMIEKVKLPRLSDKTGCYLINIKVNGKWQNVWRTRERDANTVYDTLITLQNEQSINIGRKTTYLDERNLRMCEIAVDRLNRVYSPNLVVENELILKAVENYIKQTPTLTTPPIHQAVEMFLEEREKWLSPVTFRDYKWVLNRLCIFYGDMEVKDITIREMREYFSQFENTKRATTYIYIKSFFNFCMGKENPYIQDEKGWISFNPINWKKPKCEYLEPGVLDFNSIIKILMYSNSICGELSGLRGNNKRYCRNEKELIAYYIFRLFSCVRKEEFVRIVDFGGGDISNNKFIDIERWRILLTPEVYRKKGNITGSRIGRVHEPLHPTFIEWLKWMIKNNIRLTYPKGKYRELEIEKLCKEKDFRRHNILRHTGITYHLLIHKQISLTSKIAGTSLYMIEGHYLNKNIPVVEAEKFYELNPTKAIEMGIIQK